jgi:hypothetical protein
MKSEVVVFDGFPRAFYPDVVDSAYFAINEIFTFCFSTALVQPGAIPTMLLSLALHARRREHHY